MLGVGLDYFRSSATFEDAHMTLLTLSPCLLLRVPLGKSRAFENGIIFPYVGVGVVIESLDGPVDVFFKETERHIDSVGFLGKIGLEFAIIGGWSSENGMALLGPILSFAKRELRASLVGLRCAGQAA